jgi:hypothetical protein
MQFAQPSIAPASWREGVCCNSLPPSSALLASAYHHHAHKGSVETSYQLAALTLILNTSSAFIGGTGNWKFALAGALKSKGASSAGPPVPMCTYGWIMEVFNKTCTHVTLTNVFTRTYTATKRALRAHTSCAHIIFHMRKPQKLCVLRKTKSRA